MKINSKSVEFRDSRNKKATIYLEYHSKNEDWSDWPGREFYAIGGQKYGTFYIFDMKEDVDALFNDFVKAIQTGSTFSHMFNIGSSKVITSFDFGKREQYIDSTDFSDHTRSITTINLDTDKMKIEKVS